MKRDPLGILARLNSLSLLLITPEFWSVRAKRSRSAGSIDESAKTFEIQTERITVNGLSIRIAQDRKVDLPTLVFLSPMPQSLHCYEPVWSLLRPEFDLIAIDLPGFGQSEGAPELMSFEAQSLFLNQVLQQLDVSDYHIIAPDIAMPVALEYAGSRTPALKSIMVGDGPGVLPSHDGSLIRKIVGSSVWRFVVKLSGIRTFLATAIQVGYLHYSPTRTEMHDYIASYDGRLEHVLAYFAHYPEGLKRLDAQLDSIEVPVQVFWGDSDAFLGHENANELHRRLPESELTIFKDCGHFCYQDKPADFADMIRDWVLDKCV